MSFLSVAGLRVALKEYESDKVRERAGGAERIREIFGNKENLVTFHDVGGQQGGAGWVALFQCLFQGVSVEKRGMKRGNASATSQSASPHCEAALSPK
jgi:ataxia telangiectasia mutated family protein